MSKFELALYALVISAFSAAGGAYWVSHTKAPAIYKAGYDAGRNFVDWKSAALSDKDVTNKICNAWWFQSDHTERRLKK